MTDEASAPDERDSGASAPEAGTPDESTVMRENVEVGLIRAVRHGRIIVTATAVFAVLGGIAALVVPVDPDAEYTLGQAVGQMLVVGAIVGLLLGSILALVLGIAVKRRRGAARAHQVDVQ